MTPTPYRAFTRSFFTPSHTSEAPRSLHVCPQLCTPRGLPCARISPACAQGCLCSSNDDAMVPKDALCLIFPSHSLLSRLDAAGGPVAGPVGPDETLPVRFSTRVRIFFYHSGSVACPFLLELFDLKLAVCSACTVREPWWAKVLPFSLPATQHHCDLAAAVLDATASVEIMASDFTRHAVTLVL